MTLRAGFIGLGNIGKPLASHLAPSGFDTTVYDIAEEPVRELVAGGAKAACSPRELAENADVIGICVPEDRHVLAVMNGEDGVLAGARAGSVVAIHSTILPATAIELAEQAAASGVSVLDACVTGGDQRAAEGVVTYLVGGDAEALEKARPFLDASSETVIHAGELGNGAKLKLCINVVTYIQFAAAYEGCKLAMATGLPTEVFEAAGRANGQITELQLRYLTGVKIPKEARASEAYQNLVRGHMLTAEKDLAWALKLARESGLNLPVSGLISQTMARLYGVEDDERR
ncbi:MAG: NAD(P)-dependent oxidoreductase [Deltaproteobacteria bacterium]|nr:NAD(P)-dependent oxidoreductase [Deltaproteobacteria bacterium]MBW2422221.1 NAD(P)-dependent oxidoreductase [Deltaproteobacteria bacterium]